MSQQINIVIKHPNLIPHSVGNTCARADIQFSRTSCRLSAMRLIALGFLVSLLNTGCEINSTRSSQHALLMNERVTVYITGDVKHEGYTQIRRGLSKKSVYEAAGGWAGFSELGLEPKSIGITRVENGVTNKWDVDFDNMSRGKWKYFLFQENDHIVVHILY